MKTTTKNEAKMIDQEKKEQQLLKHLTYLIDDMAKLTKLEKYHTHNQKSYRLACIGGDMSAGALGNKAKIIEVSKDHYAVVNRYLHFYDAYYANNWGDSIVQQRLDFVMKKAKIKSATVNDLLAKVEQMDTEIRDQMFERGIFTSKFDVRSSWAWLETCDFDDEAYDKDHESEQEEVETA